MKFSSRLKLTLVLATFSLLFLFFLNLSYCFLYDEKEELVSSWGRIIPVSQISFSATDSSYRHIGLRSGELGSIDVLRGADPLHFVINKSSSGGE